jgi:hypothetical protein
VSGDDGCSRRVRSAAEIGVRVSDAVAREIGELLGRGRVRLARS